VAKNTDATAALVELGFVSNSGDAAKLSSEDYRQRFAQAIADGILQTLGYE
jgi:N-acetylmuramoyl-L-alanine amidase